MFRSCTNENTIKNSRPPSFFDILFLSRILGLIYFPYFNITLQLLLSNKVEMADVDTLRLKTFFHILGLCLTWYSVSSGNNIVGKIILNDFPYPMTVSMCQLLSITVYLYPLLFVWGVPRQSLNKLKTKYWIIMILPLAFGKFFSSFSSHISLWRVPVSYTHTGTLKCKHLHYLEFSLFIQTICREYNVTMKISCC